MSQSLSGRSKGRYGAPPEAGTGSPWRAAPLYVLVPLTLVSLVASVPAWLANASCGDRGSTVCINAGVLRDVESGTRGGIVAVTGVLFAVALVLLLIACLRVSKGPLWLAYGFAVLSLLMVVYAFLALNGSVPTPAGSLGGIPHA